MAAECYALLSGSPLSYTQDSTRRFDSPILVGLLQPHARLCRQGSTYGWTAQRHTLQLDMLLLSQDWADARNKLVRHHEREACLEVKHTFLKTHGFTISALPMRRALRPSEGPL